MTVAENVMRGLLQDNIDEIKNRMMETVIGDHHNIHDVSITRTIGDKYGSQVSNAILSNMTIIEMANQEVEDEEDSQEKSVETVQLFLEKWLDDEIDTGTLLFEITQGVITDDVVRTTLIDDISDMVSTYDGYDASSFAGFLNSKPLDVLVNASNSGDYDALYEEYIDNQE